MTSSHQIWSTAWQEAQHDVALQAALILLAFNGIPLDELKTLTWDQVDIESGWLQTQDAAYPLVTQSITALSNLPQTDDALIIIDANAFLRMEALEIDERDSQRRLAGAIWFTSREGQDIMQLTGESTDPILPLRFTFPFSVVEALKERHDTEVGRDSIRTLQAAADWLEENTAQIAEPLTFQKIKSLLLQGTIVFAIANLGVNGLNFFHNLVMGRLLSPQQYGELSLIITLQLILSLVPNGIQTVSSRFGAAYVAKERYSILATLHTRGRRFALPLGIATGFGLLLFASPLSHLFNISEWTLFVPIALATPFFFSMGIERGVLQATDNYYWLAAAYLSEALIRLGLGVVLVLALDGSGGKLDGAVWAVGQAMVVTWFVAWLGMRFVTFPEAEENLEEWQQWWSLFRLTTLGLIGQMVITNSDFLLVKSLFDPTTSGQYAAVTVLGRMVYFGVLPLSILVVPRVSRQQALGESTVPTLMLLMGGGAAVCSGIILVSTFFPTLILSLLYGDAYTDVANLLPIYTVAAALFVMANLMLMYRIALGRGAEMWLPAAGGVLQIIGILAFHNTLQQVIFVQIAVMALLLILVSARMYQDRASWLHS